MGASALLVCTLLTFAPFVLLEESCNDWSPLSQASEPSLYLHFAAGRLAARLTPYVILLILKKKHGLNVMVDKASHDSVTEFFALPSESLLHVTEEQFCPSALKKLKQHMQNFTQNSPDKLESALVALAQGQVVNLWPEGPLETANYWVPDNLIREYGPWIKQLFQFKPEYQKDAAARLEGVRAIAGSDKKVLFVGLHVRRTDYVQFSKQVLGKRVASKAFYKEAMDYFEEEYPDHSVYFLAVSDDLNWVRKHLGGRKNLVVAGSHGSGEEDGLGEVGKDLALLAACDHTIVSQGLFGTWGGFLAGGDVYSTYGVMVRDVLS